jgi:hypothetical protein
MVLIEHVELKHPLNDQVGQAMLDKTTLEERTNQFKRN